MGYTTDFYGEFKADKSFDKELTETLLKLNDTRRMKRPHLGPEYGIEGEFYLEDNENGVVDHNCPPRTQPGLWCQWTPNGDSTALEWDGGEKFYHYVEWLAYIVKTYISPRGYILNGEVKWEGEGLDDCGTIVMKDNIISLKHKNPIRYDSIDYAQIETSNQQVASDIANRILLEDHTT